MLGGGGRAEMSERRGCATARLRAGGKRCAPLVAVAGRGLLSSQSSQGEQESESGSLMELKGGWVPAVGVHLRANAGSDVQTRYLVPVPIPALSLSTLPCATL